MVSWPIVGIYVYVAFSLVGAAGVWATLKFTQCRRDTALRDPIEAARLVTIARQQARRHLEPRG